MLCFDVFLKVAGFGIKVKTNILFYKYWKVLDNKKLTLTLDFFFLSCSFHLRHFSFNYFDYDYCKDLAFLTEPTVSKATNQLANPKNAFSLSADSP